jgi:hypothetical protein
MDYKEQLDVDEPAPPKRNCSFSRLFTSCAAGMLVVVIIVSACLNMYTYAMLSPVIVSVDQVINRANVLYNLIYTYGCVTTQFIPSSECTILRGV